MNLKLFTPPAVEPVSLADIVAHLRIDSSDEDSLLLSMIEAARDYCENYQNRAYITQTWELALDTFPSVNEITLPRPLLQSAPTAPTVKYYDTVDVEATMAAADYMVDNYAEPGRIVLKYGKTWPSTILRPANGVIIKYVAGYGATAATVPERIIQAIKLLVGHMYENRESTDIKELKEIPFAVHSLLGLDRIWPL
jgi:uncharacterized phiE125 gp8 family phage protein